MSSHLIEGIFIFVPMLIGFGITMYLIIKDDFHETNPKKKLRMVLPMIVGMVITVGFCIYFGSIDWTQQEIKKQNLIKEIPNSSCNNLTKSLFTHIDLVNREFTYPYSDIQVLNTTLNTITVKGC